MLAAVSAGRSPILLTERRDHLAFFERKLSAAVRNLVVLHGGLGSKARRAALERLAAIPETEERIVLATGRYVGEGFDDSRLDAPRETTIEYDASGTSRPDALGLPCLAVPQGVQLPIYESPASPPHQ